MTIDYAFLQQRYEDSQVRGSGDSGDYYKPEAAPLGMPPKRNKALILRAHPNMLVRGRDMVERPFPIIEMWLHYGLGPKQDCAAPCLEWFGLPCPACEWVAEIFHRAKSDPTTWKDLGYRLRKKPQFYANVVNLLNPVKGVQTYRFGKEVNNRILACFYDNSIPAQPRDITDPQRSYPLILDMKTEKGKGNNTDTFPVPETIKADDQPVVVLPEWLEQIQDLRAREVWQPTEAQVKGALHGQKALRVGTTAVVSLPSASHLSPVPGLAPGTPIPLAAPVPGSLSVAPPAAPAVAPAAHVPGPQAVTSPPVPVAPTAVPGPQAAPTAAAPAAGKRGKKVAGKAAAATAPAPAAAATTAPAADPLDLAQAFIIQLGTPIGFTTPIRLPREEIDFNDLPSCYGIDQDITDINCQQCPASVWCRAVMMHLIPAA